MKKLLLLLMLLFSSTLVGCTTDEQLIAGRTYIGGEVYGMYAVISYVPSFDTIQIDENLMIVEDSDYGFMGQHLEVFKLSPRNFDELAPEPIHFYDESSGSMANLRINNLMAYYVLSLDDSIIWYFLIQNDGTTYLTWLWSNEAITYIFKLEENE